MLNRFLPLAALDAFIPYPTLWAEMAQERLLGGELKSLPSESRPHTRTTQTSE